MTLAGKDPDADPVMPIILRVERDSPPSSNDALCAAGSAALRAWLRIQQDELVPATTENVWSRNPKKLVRRARRGDWAFARSLAVTSVQVDTAEVAVLCICRLKDLPSRIRRLPISGLELHGAGCASESKLFVDEVEFRNGQGVERPTVWVTPKYAMSTGKTMAQIGHATIGLWLQIDEAQRHAWLVAGLRVNVRLASFKQWEALRASSGLSGALVVVKDAGLTELEPGTVTAIGTWSSHITSELG